MLIWHRINIYLSVIFIIFFGCKIAVAFDNVKFSGELVSEPCTIDSEDSTTTIDFGTIIDKYLYTHDRTESQTVTLHLTGCDKQQANTVHLALIGSESLGLTGYLKITMLGAESGVALGFENIKSGKLIAINDNKNDNGSWKIMPGDNYIKFSSFIQAEPLAIKNKSITRGEFNTIVYFRLFYD